MSEMLELKTGTRENNLVTLKGKVGGEFCYSHEICGEGFYTMELVVNRHSPSIDRIPVLASERILDISRNYTGCQMEIRGELRSYNHEVRRHHYVRLMVFAHDMEITQEAGKISYTDNIFLDGYLCKKPVYRLTPLGREIADVILAVNRAYGRTDYIPCILWGRNARYAARFRPGVRLLLWGRLQSREYSKRLFEDLTVRRTTYEVSVRKLILSEK